MGILKTVKAVASCTSTSASVVRLGRKVNTLALACPRLGSRGGNRANVVATGRRKSTVMMLHSSPKFDRWQTQRLSNHTEDTAIFWKQQHRTILRSLSETRSSTFVDEEESDHNTLLSVSKDNNTVVPGSAKEKNSFVRDKRKKALHESLNSMNINGETLNDALKQSQQQPMDGYDNRFGRSAIRTYKAFLYPKQQQQQQHDEESDLSVSALRCARQIEFLIKRHRSHSLEWVRHHDTKEDNDANSSRERLARTTTFPLTILLDNVRSAFNVGSIFRTADACACREVITTGITPHPYGSGSEKVRKTSLGADQIVPTRHFSTTVKAIEELRQSYGINNISIIGIETTDKSLCYTSSDIAYPKIGGGTVLVFGNEVTGVDTEILPLLDFVIEVPMFGQKNSLNVSACAPVIMYEVLRQWGATNKES